LSSGIQRLHTLEAFMLTATSAPKPAGALDARAIEPHRNPLGSGRCGFKQFLLLRSTGDLLGQQPGAGAAFGVELAQLRDGFLYYLAPAPHRADQPLIAMLLAVLAPNRVPQIQPPLLPPPLRSLLITAACAAHRKYQKSHYTPFPQLAPAKSLATICPPPDRKNFFVLELRKLG
jgi:hypothetical protein